MNEQRETVQGFLNILREPAGEMLIITETFWVKKERNVLHVSGVASSIWMEGGSMTLHTVLNSNLGLD